MCAILSQQSFERNSIPISLMPMQEMCIRDSNGDVEDKRAGEDAGRGSGTESDLSLIHI